jgi:hypothetical protein
MTFINECCGCKFSKVQAIEGPGRLGVRSSDNQTTCLRFHDPAAKIDAIEPSEKHQKPSNFNPIFAAN